MKAPSGGGQVTDALVLSSALMWTVSGQLKARALYLGKNLGAHCAHKILGEPQSRTGRFGEKKNPSSLPGFQLRIVQPVTRYLSRSILVSRFFFLVLDPLQETKR